MVKDSLLWDNQDGNAALDVCQGENITLNNNTLLANGDHFEITNSQLVKIAGNQGTNGADAVELIGSHFITIEGNRFNENRREVL